MAKSKKKKTPKAFKKFKHFIAHMDAYSDLQGVVGGAQRKDKWAGYAAALGAIESISDEAKITGKTKKRKRQAIKYLHKLAKHAGGAKAVRPPKVRVAKKAKPLNEKPLNEKSSHKKTSKISAGNVVSIKMLRAEVPSGLIRDERQPASLRGPRDGLSDDLKMVAGIGPKLEKLLHGLGVYHFDQIARWTSEQVLWVDEHLRFSGRITREDWIAQAAALAKGGRDEYVRVFGKEPR